MKVSPNEPFQIIYSLFQHEYLGYTFESFIVHLDERGKLTYQHQNIAGKNAKDFAKGLDKTDFELIEWMDKMNQDSIVRKWGKKSAKPKEFLSKVFDPEKGDKPLRTFIKKYAEDCRKEILPRLKGKFVFEMGNDGEPAWRQLCVLPEPASVQFHFKRTSENTTYYPTMTFKGEKLPLPDPSAYMICKEPAWFVINNNVYHFENEVDGRKILPFFNKDKVVIPKKLEENYYRNFVASLIESVDGVTAEGFTIVRAEHKPRPVLTLSELPSATKMLPLFNAPNEEEPPRDETGKIVFSLSFKYGKYKFGGESKSTGVVFENDRGDYKFYRIPRQTAEEKNYVVHLQKLGLPVKGVVCSLYKGLAFSWLNENRGSLLNLGFEVSQPDQHDKKYFVGKAVMELEVRENIDWFDIYAKILFGDFEISFKELRKLILRKKVEFKLPNGEIAIIPEAWLVKYKDLFMMSESEGSKEKPILRKYHLHLLQELSHANLAKVTISERLRGLESFQGIKNYPPPKNFKGTLRPYQKAGYNWMMFLNEFRLGGCLADDMGLGKTVQTLALLQAEKEKGEPMTSLIVMPTSLIYNWAQEAKKYAPQLRALMYTGAQRNKDISQFGKYDIVLTSYGVTRLDIDLFEKFAFHYCILDESQVIKNPSSNIAKAVLRLKARFRLTLTGTPVENSTMDLWSQMTFINPGILGIHAYFKKEYQVPIEKKADEARAQKLNTIIKPFVLRRLKSQVAFDLPEKTENIYYTNMTPEQESRYEEAKNYYRGKILKQIEAEGFEQAHMTILEGLSKLRQLSNHPHMIDPSYSGDSGKMEDVSHMIDNAVLEGHKILLFSQFVKHLTLFRDLLHKKGISFAYLDGATSEKERAHQIDRFNKEEAIKIFLISIKAGGLGLNLTQADYVFILDPWWNPAVEAQAIDRAHRIGQKRKVFTYKFITRNTVEEKILRLQNHKQKLSDSLIHADESIMKNLTREEALLLLT